MFFKDLFTEKDGISFCPVRATYLLGFIAIIVFTFHDIWTGKDFITSAGQWISGIANYLGLGGAAVAGKNYTEKE